MVRCALEITISIAVWTERPLMAISVFCNELFGYAFAGDGFVDYIGVTQTGIRTRMGHYKRAKRT